MSAASAPEPVPLSMARWMLSLGMLPSLAFWTASASAGFISGSPPPSRAATVIALDSFPKSAPRFASAAPFFLLIVDHLLCPLNATHLLQKVLVKPHVVRQLRMESRDQYVLPPRGHDLVIQLGHHLHPGADVLEVRRPNEDPRERPVEAFDVQICLKRVYLPPEAVAHHQRVHDPEQRLARPRRRRRREHHPRASPPNRSAQVEVAAYAVQ